MKKKKVAANSNHEKNQAAWNAYHKDYMKFNLQYRPDYYEFYSNKGVSLDSYIPRLAGDVSGLKLLDICCACDASQAFSWTNLGADVTACDISTEAIRIAEENAKKLNLNVAFFVADAQTLDPIKNISHDIVFATYLDWFEDINAAVKTWYRVLRSNGRLIIHIPHPVTQCLDETDGSLTVGYDYSRNTPFEEDSWNGTPMASKFGGWSIDLPVVEYNHRISDIMTAVINTGFTVEIFHESETKNDGTDLSKLPEDLLIIARKRD